MANLGYAECRFHQPVVPGDTLRTRSEVIGLKQNSNGRTGVVHVRSTATNQRGETALDWCRWVMVHKRDADAPAPETVVPELAAAVAVDDLVIPAGLDFTAYDFVAAGEPHRLGDYEVGERIDHVDGVTLTDPEHMMATRLWQNTAKVHFNTDARPDGRRLIYGGHVISMARALSFNGLANAQLIAAINAGVARRPGLRGRHGPRLVGGARPRRDVRARRRCPAPAPRGHPRARRVDDAARRRREVRRGRAARPRLLDARPRLSSGRGPGSGPRLRGGVRRHRREVPSPAAAASRTSTIGTANPTRSESAPTSPVSTAPSSAPT